MGLDFVRSNKGANHLVFEGYRFLQDSHNKNEDKRHWKYVEYKISKCRGRVTTQGDEVIRNNDDHNHSPSQGRISARKAFEEMKKLSKSSLEPPHQILSSVVPSTSPAAQAQLPRIPAMLRTIQRQRQIANSPVAIPKCVNDLVVPREFKITDKGEDFLLVDEGRDSSRVIMLCTKENLVHLYSSNQIFADGTFKSCPLLFSQFFTIHGVVYGKVFPLVYVLLKNKEERSYLRMLDVLKSNVSQDWNPATVTTYFEKALINAFTQKFPRSRHQGCFFHLTQCIWRKIQTLPGTCKEYKSNDLFAQNVKMLAALAFLPVTDVVFGFEILQNSEFFLQNSELQSLLDYFEETWVGKRYRHGNTRALGLYCLQSWHFYEATLNGEARTNNSLEGWHRGFSSRLGGEHPNIWKFMKVLKQEQGLTELKITQLGAGMSPHPTRINYRECADRLLAKTSSYAACVYFVRCIDVPLRLESPKVVSRGIFAGARVVRGPDWDWGNQDGGEGKVGRVVDIRGWDNDSGRSVANVIWSSGSTNVYRLGHKGKVDLKCVRASSAGSYYVNHLSILGIPSSTLNRNSLTAPAKGISGKVQYLFNVGDKVQDVQELSRLKEMQEV